MTRTTGQLALALLALALSGPLLAQDMTARVNVMQAHHYGAPEVARLEEIDKPVPNDDQVLVRVVAAAVNPLDWHYVRGTPYVMRLDSGLFEPKTTRMGVDMSGVVEAVGKNVTRFKPGDEVFGIARGAFGEYARAGENRIAVKPEGLTFQQAAAMPVAAVTALQALRDKAGLKTGQKVLINGASGGVGTYAVQIAKALGADVTAVCSTRNVDLVRGLGADRVIDYTQQDFTAGAQRYDIVLDNVGNRDMGDIRRILVPGGVHVLVGGGGPNDNPVIGPFGAIIGAYLAKPFVDQRFEMLIAEVTTADLDILSDMAQAGTLRSVIDRVYPLADTAAALTYLEQGRARGKVIVAVGQEPAPHPAADPPAP